MKLVPPADLYVPALRLRAVSGVAVDVPDEIAGRSPDPGLEAAMDAHRAAVTARDHNEAARLRDVIIGMDPGAGLLAQGWARADGEASAAPVDPATPPTKPTRPRAGGTKPKE